MDERGWVSGSPNQSRCRCKRRLDQGAIDAAFVAAVRQPACADDGTGSDYTHARCEQAHREISRSDGCDRSYGGLSGRPTERAGEADCPGTLSEGVCEDFPYVVAVEAGLSVAGCAGTGETPAWNFWPAAVDVGDR